MAAWLKAAEEKPEDWMNAEGMSSYERQEIRMQQGIQELLLHRLKHRLDQAQDQGYEALLAAHTADYRELFDRTYLELSIIHKS